MAACWRDASVLVTPSRRRSKTGTATFGQDGTVAATDAVKKVSAAGARWVISLHLVGR